MPELILRSLRLQWSCAPSTPLFESTTCPPALTGGTEEVGGPRIAPDARTGQAYRRVGVARERGPVSATVPKLPTWYRALAVVVGILSIVVALIVLVEPLLALWLLILLLAVGLLFVGVDRLMAGITGHPMVHVIPVLTVKEESEAGAAAGSAPPPKP